MKTSDSHREDRSKGRAEPKCRSNLAGATSASGVSSRKPCSLAPIALSISSFPCPVGHLVRLFPWSLVPCSTVPALPWLGNGLHRSEHALAYDDLRDWIKALEKARRTQAHPRRSFAGARNHRDHRPREQDGLASARSRSGNSKEYAPGGPALLFENIKGHPGHKVLINQFGSERRMAMALGVDRLDEIAERITGLMNMKPPRGTASTS